MNSDSGDVGSSDEYAALKEKIKEFNEKGGKSISVTAITIMKCQLGAILFQWREKRYYSKPTGHMTKMSALYQEFH